MDIAKLIAVIIASKPVLDEVREIDNYFDKLIEGVKKDKDVSKAAAEKIIRSLEIAKEASIEAFEDAIKKALTD